MQVEPEQQELQGYPPPLYLCTRGKRLTLKGVHPNVSLCDDKYGNNNNIWEAVHGGTAEVHVGADVLRSTTEAALEDAIK